MTKNIIKRLVSTLTIVAMAVGPMISTIVVPNTAFAALPAGYFIQVTNTTPGALSLTLAGIASANPYKGSGNGQFVRVTNWGDGTAMTDATLSNTIIDGSAKTFATNWSVTHNYTTSGSKTITVSICHQNCTGNDGNADSTATFDVFIPPAALTVITHVINNSGGSATAANITMTVSGVTASPSSFAGVESPGQLVNVTASTTPLSYTVTGSNLSGYTKTSSGDCATTIASGQNKTCTFTYDDILPPPPNTAPKITSISDKNINESTLLSFTVQASDSDTPTQTLAYSLGSGAPAGASINGTSGAFMWTPTEAQGPGAYSITVNVSDGIVSTSTSFTVTVNEVNAAPTLASISDQNVNELSNLSLQASSTDSDIPVQTLTYSLGTAPSGATISSGGTFSWTPTETQGPGTYPVTVIVSDGVTTASKIFQVTVNEFNSAPVVSGTTISTHLNTPKVITLPGSDSDIPAQTLTFIVGTPTNGTLGTTTGNQVEYTPNPGFVGTDQFTFTATDGVETSNTATVNITVDDTAPSIIPIQDKNVNEHATSTFIAQATDPDNDPITYSLTNAPAGATIDSNTGEFNWVPSEDQGPGVYTITVTATAGSMSDSTTFKISVSEVNEAPTAQDASDTTDFQTAKLLTLTATDSDIPAQTLIFSTIGNPSHGTLGIVSGNQVEYTPNTGYSGPDSFDFKANDGMTDSNIVTFNITVSPDMTEVTLLRCSDGLDNDNDQLTDLADPDCAAYTPKLTVNKVVINNDGGTATTSDFQLFIDQTQVTSGVTSTSTVGAHTVSEAATSTYLGTISGDCDAQGNVTLAAGDNKVCTITNDDIAPKANHPPVITIIGNNPATVTVNNAYNDLGATSADQEDGTTLVTSTSTVDTSIIGSYTVTYTTVDSGGLGATSTRTVNVVAASNSGGGGGGSSSFSSGGSYVGNGGQVLGATACSEYLNDYIKPGADNDPEEVTKLQTFLNQNQGEHLTVNGIYDEATQAAVDRFQSKYSADVLQPWVDAGFISGNAPTGYVYKTTRRMINNLACATLGLPIPDLSGEARPTIQTTTPSVNGTSTEATSTEPIIGENTPSNDNTDQLAAVGNSNSWASNWIIWLIIVIILGGAAGFYYARKR